MFQGGFGVGLGMSGFGLNGMRGFGLNEMWLGGFEGVGLDGMPLGGIGGFGGVAGVDRGNSVRG